MASPMNQGPPYLPTTWALGGRPSKSVDVPITAVFMVLYIIGAAWHMTIFQLNQRRGHKFFFSVVLFGFDMARIVTCVLRIASICVPTNTNLSIAASVFLGAGVLILYIINLLFSRRILRSLHPKIGWHRITSLIFIFLFTVTGLTLVINITSTVQSFFTLRPRTRQIDRSLQLYGQTFLAIVSLLPILVLLVAFATPRRSLPEQFGSGRLRTKVAILLTGSTLITLGAWYRYGTMWHTPVPRTQPLPGYFAKPCFYIFNFGVEIPIVYLYAIMRVDRRFYVPDGAKGPGSYEMQTGTHGRAGNGADISDEEEGEAEITKAM